MAHIEWIQEYETGISILDTQQKRFVELINELDDANQSLDKDKVNHVIEGLLHYTVTYFELEESLLEKSGYPYLKAHRRIHEIFMKKLSEIRARSIKGENVASELLEFLKNWLHTHIQGEDRDFVESVKIFTGNENENKEASSWLDSAIKKFMS